MEYVQEAKVEIREALTLGVGGRLYCDGNTDYFLNYLSVLMVFRELRTGDLFSSPSRLLLLN